MVIERDLYLDDGSASLVSLRLQSRSLATHSLLSALTADEQGEVGAAMARALEEIGRVLRAKLAREGPPAVRA